MSVKIRRYNANESDFTQTGRVRTNIEVPGSVGITDLTNSKLIFDMHVDVYEGNVNNKLHIPTTFGDGQMVGGAQALIRNTSVTSKMYGLLNERRQQNVISANLDWYTTSRAGEDAKCLSTASSNANYGISRVSKIPDCPFVLLNRPDAVSASAVTIASQSRRAEIQIPWKHCDNFSNMQQFPNAAVGDLVYNIQLEDQLTSVFPAVMPTRAAVPCANITAAATVLGTATNPFVLQSSVIDGFNRPPKIGDICYVVFYGSTTAYSHFCLQQAKITNLTIVAGKYNVFTTAITATAAAEVCTNVFMFYYGMNESSATNTVNGFAGLFGGGQDVIPILANVVSDGGYIIGNAGVPLKIAHNTPGGLRLIGGSAYPNTVLTKEAFDSCPWFVGAPVQVAYVIPADSGASPLRTTILQTTIASLKITATETEIVLTEPVDLPNAGTGVCPFVAVCHRDVYYNDSLATVPTSGKRLNCTWVVDEIYAELNQLTLLPSQMASVMKAMSNISIPFMDQLLVQRNMPTSNTHTDVVQAYANTVGLAVLTPQNLQFLSGTDHCEAYRFTIDGKQVTNQDIVVGRPTDFGRSLHNILLKSFFANIGKTLMKYDIPNCLDLEEVGNRDTATHHIFPLIVPATSGESVVQLQLFTNGADMMTTKNIWYVWYVAKQLNISNGRVSIS